MNFLYFNFYGVKVCLGSASVELLDNLRRDFWYFLSAEFSLGQTGVIRWKIEIGEPARDFSDFGRPKFKNRQYAVYDAGPLRSIDYQGQATARYNYSNRSGEIIASNLALAHELTYLALLSRAGEEMDLRGLHRIHALGFVHSGSAALVALPSGGGKSTLALEMLRHPDFSILSDDSPLIGPDLLARAFPLRFGFALETDLSGLPEQAVRVFTRRFFPAKKLVDSNVFPGKIAPQAKAGFLFFGRRGSGGAPGIKSLNRVATLYRLLPPLVIGVGIAQMAEYTIRIDFRQLRRLACVAWSRLKAAISLALSVPAFDFNMSNDAKLNLQLLADLMAQKNG